MTVACELDMITEYLQQIHCIGLSCRVQRPPSFQAPRPCSAVKHLQIWLSLSSFANCLKSVYYNNITIRIRFSHDIVNSADNTDLGFVNSRYHAQPHPIIIIAYC